ncbi:MAG: GspMb/PilO family protein [Candidatus Saccharicenans sp.]|nr:GspMb/PilO family protein [Candidatus Saccharicenans sp.]
MPGLIDFLSSEERKKLRRLGLLAGFLVLLMVASLFFWSHRLNSLRFEANRLTEEAEKIISRIDQIRQEYQSWVETQKDLEEMEKTAFYQAADGLEAFRQDLKTIFQQSGLPQPPISYQYETAEKKQFKRLAASFALRLSYPALKKFLYRVESWPRLLLVDQINFQKIDNFSGMLEVRITISGYYHEKNM